MQEAGEWCSIAEASRRLGISRQGVQDRLRRRKMECREDNRGNRQVLVPALAEQGTAVSASKVLAPPRPTGTDLAAAIAAAIAAVQEGHGAEVAAIRAEHHRELARERRRTELAEAMLELELTRPLSILERIVGHRIPQGQPA